jgi:hypothetical protein
VREECTVPFLTELRGFLLATMQRVSKKSDLAGAMAFETATRAGATVKRAFHLLSGERQ